ncbi:uncharacterized protein LOC126902635 [Daktulosphaira vitifoliae]|uniref:uncharacterized protein LOC126902635 n=1 Tax=Daktulosphaira vitifoliae TaxID=58002 RepID=UPI0021AA67E5|nr:uncharacterized protein LOC126902635 [Daktulosphaira vitifoliae]
MNGKIIFCLLVVFFGQTLSATNFMAGSELKNIADQFSNSAVSISQHVSSAIDNDIQTSLNWFNLRLTESFINLESKLAHLKTLMKSYASPEIMEAIESYEKKLKKLISAAKEYFKEKITQPINNNNIENEIAKYSNQIIKATKNSEDVVNRAINRLTLK